MKKAVPLVLASTLVLSGCFWEKEEVKPEPPPTDVALTIADLKERYKDSADKDIMPLYNVSQNEVFEFKFKSYVGDIPFNDVISVHTDHRVEGESKLNVEITPESFTIGPSTLRVKALESALLDSNIESNWGIAPTYYIRVNYDLDSETPTRLEQPIVIPFTIKSSTQAPHVALNISDDGRVKLQWSKVEGATQYKVYNVTKHTSTETDKGKDASQLGFGGYTVYNIGAVTATEFQDWEANGRNGLELNAQNKGLKGDYYVTAVANGKESLASNLVSINEVRDLAPLLLEDTDMNASNHETVRSLPKTVKVELLNGEYADYGVRYASEGVEIKEGSPTSLSYVVPNSTFKGVVTVDKMSQGELEALAEVNKPDNVLSLSETINKTAYTPSLDLPSVVVTASTTEKVESEGEDKETDEDKTVEGQKDTDKQTEPDASNQVEGDVEVEQSTEEGKTEEDKPEEDKAEVDVELIPEGMIPQQKFYTEKALESANLETIVSPVILETNSYKLTVNSALEEYVGLSLLGVTNEISLKAFPDAQTYEVISDVMDKVIYQNPLIIGVTSWQYDYAKQAILVEYSGSSSDIQSKQQALLHEARTVVNNVIYGYDEEKIAEEQEKVDKLKTAKKWWEFWKKYEDVKVEPKNPNPVERQKLLYDYLNDNVEYGLVKGGGKETPEQETTSEETQPNTEQQVVNIDPYTAYGVLVNKVGTGQGYALAYKLLSDIAGLETITVTGKDKGKQHVWNKTKVDNTWLNVDTSKNTKNIGVPYMVYNMNDAIAKTTNLVEDRRYWLDHEIVHFTNTVILSDYYAKNSLVVDSLNDYAVKLGERLQAGDKTVIIRTEIKLDPQQLYDATALTLQKYVPEKLVVAQFGELGNYMIILTDPPKDEEEVEAEEEEEVEGVEDEEEVEEQATTETPETDATE